METENLLRVNRVKKYYPMSHGLFISKPAQVKAVNDITFTIGEGETMALVGESGCGKTTIAKLILRLENLTEGEILLRDKDVHALRGDEYRWYRSQMQAVFQDPWASLNPRMRVRNIVVEPLIINQKVTHNRAKERVEEVLVDVGLDPLHADRFPHEFSGGQRQRIAVASALVSNPKVIILDEPVSSLDVSIRAQIMNMFRDVQKKYNVSYLLIAHDLGTTRYLSDKIAVMYLGKIVACAPTEVLFNNPLHPYTKALFSAALPSHPDLQREEIVLKGEVPSPIHPPSGCPFHPRCPMKIGKICEQDVPVLRRQGYSDHWVSCHLFQGSESGSAG